MHETENIEQFTTGRVYYTQPYPRRVRKNTLQDAFMSLMLKVNVIITIPGSLEKNPTNLKRLKQATLFNSLDPYEQTAKFMSESTASYVTHSDWQKY